MTLTPALIAAFATLFAAGVAATVSLVVSVLSKEQKTSEFRQQWIDSLRADISEFVGEIALLYGYADMVDSEKEIADVVAYEQRYANMVRARGLAIRIELRLNPAEHGTLLSAMMALRHERVLKSMKERERCVDTLIAESQRLLKTEWARVKLGEPAFVWTKRIAATLVLTAFAIAAALAIRAW